MQLLPFLDALVARRIWLTPAGGQRVCVGDRRFSRSTALKWFHEKGFSLGDERVLPSFARRTFEFLLGGYGITKCL